MKPAVCLLVVMALTGCSARKPLEFDAAAPDARAARAMAEEQHRQSLSEYIARVQALAAEARPARPQPVSIEGSDPRLAGALALAAMSPSPSSLRAVAEAYRHVGVADRAHEYLQAALKQDRRDAATYDALARWWRDAGFPSPALADAHRAVYYAPDSAVARNTLGTVLQLLGRHSDARQQYEQSVRLDARAAYALNNLCYAWVLEGDLRRAAAACDGALAIEPRMAAAHNNRGLVHALAGNLEAAQVAFASGGDTAAALYNLGIVHMAHQQYEDAVSAFAAAHQARPAWRLAEVRARQAGELAAGVEE